MSDIEEKVQKHLVAFCKYLPKHQQIWSDTLQKASKCVEWLCNHAEQLRYVEGAQIEYIDDFDSQQSRLQYLILEGIEEQIAALKGYMDTLNRANFELWNKVSTFERCSLDLSTDSDIARGSPFQPEINNLLQRSIEYWLNFSDIMKHMNKCHKEINAINVRSEKFMTALEDSFKVNISDNRVRYLLELTQYVDNHEALT